MKIRRRQIHFFILLFGMCSLLFHPPLDYEANATDGWYNDSWDFRKKITASLDTVISSDLTDFPYLVSVTDSDLTQAAESDGSDIVFTASDGTTELDYEMEKFDQSTGEIIAWVKIPTVFGSVNTDIYMYYKGTSTSSSSPWDDNYNLVWHLNQDSDGGVDDFTDSSGNENHGTSGGTGKQAHQDSRETSQVAGQIGFGQKFAGANIRNTNQVEGAGDYIWINKVGSWPTGDATIELWVGDISASGNANGENWNDQFSYCIDDGGNSAKENHWNLWRTKKIKMKVRTDFFVSTSRSVEGDNSASYTNWNHIVAVYNLNENGQGASKLYINGEQRGSSSRSASETYSILGGGAAVLGGDIDGNKCNKVNNGYNGKMDEFRISNTLRSADWAAASYCNQSGSNECQTMGSEEPRPLTVTITTSNGTCGDTISSDGSITFSYTATFSTSTSDFTIGDITVSGGTVSNFDGNGTTYTFDVVVSESKTVTVSIAGSVATNTAAAENSVSNTCALTGDIPIVTIASTTSPTTHCSGQIILGNCGTVAINDDVYSIIHTWTNVPTTEVLVGEPVTVTLSTPNNPTYTKIHFASIFTEIFNSPTNYEQSTHVDYSVMNSKVTYVSQSQLFQVAGATHRITEDPNIKNLDRFEVVFTMIFAKPMETSHIVVETENKFGIPETLYLTSALKVNENLPQALTLEEKSKFELEYETVVPEPPMEPDVKITCGEGTVLKNNLCVPKEWSFLDFFQQLMKLFD